MIWPGRGAEGTGLAAIGCRTGVPGGVGGVATGAAGASGAGRGGAGMGRRPLPNSGGRTGCAAGRAAIFSSVVSPGGNEGATEGRACGGSATGASAWPCSGPACTSATSSGSSAASAVTSRAGRSTKTPKWRRILSATSSSIELEWVFLSLTPNWGRTAMIALFGCSHSRASSLIRILRITTLFSWTAYLGRQNPPYPKLRDTLPELAPFVL